MPVHASFPFPPPRRRRGDRQEKRPRKDIQVELPRRAVGGRFPVFFTGERLLVSPVVLLFVPPFEL
eukprot:4505113-Pyramimonas_sp.AAC.1